MIITEALTWLGTPYHSGAKIKGAGVDCGQLLIAVFETVGAIPVGECAPGYYSPEWHLHKNEQVYETWIKKYCDAVEVPQRGDIAMFNFGRCASHAGFIVGDGTNIHSVFGRGVIISALNESLLCYNNGKSRLTGYFRVKAVK